MQTCSNCNDSFDDSKDGLVVTGKGKHVAAICGACCADVRVGKIVVRRPDHGGYVYDQWLPTEVMGGAAG
jgi:hypothetical protein